MKMWLRQGLTKKIDQAVKWDWHMQNVKKGDSQANPFVVEWRKRIHVADLNYIWCEGFVVVINSTF